MLFAIPPSPAPTLETQVVTMYVAPLAAGFHHGRLTRTSSIWALKGNPKSLLDDHAFELKHQSDQP